jgi:hypothetical protein
MRYETTDPMTGNDVRDLEHAPFVIEGAGDNALTIYFESEASKQEYLSLEADWPPADIISAYNKTTGQAMEM